MENIDVSNSLKNSFSKDEEFLSGIFQELQRKFPDETNRQWVIRGMTLLFESRYPEDVKLHERNMKYLRETRSNEEASSDKIDMRLAFATPQSLITRINMVFTKLKQPLFLSEEAIEKYGEDEWLKNNFKQFVVPQKY